jgi:hypothetical protein
MFGKSIRGMTEDNSLVPSLQVFDPSKNGWNDNNGWDTKRESCHCRWFPDPQQPLVCQQVMVVVVVVVVSPDAASSQPNEMCHW